MMPKQKTIRSAKEIGAVIRKRRKALGITQKMLALQTGTSVPTIIAVERGNEKSGIGVALALCEGLGIELTADF